MGAVGHLDDLLLRRVRLGLALPQGGAGVLGRVRDTCLEELGWSAARWEEEVGAYDALWRRHYSVPEGEADPPAAERGGEAGAVRRALGTR